MFKKMQNHKGFTLIEMLVVIAIIAILVAVIIPVVNGSTDKAAAATNASNLRGVEGEIITMMLLDPTIFGDQEGEFDRIQGEIDDINNDTENITNLSNAVSTAANGLTSAINAASKYLGYTFQADLELTKDEVDKLQSDESTYLTNHANSSHWRGMVNLITCSTCQKSSAKIGIYEAQSSYAGAKAALDKAVSDNNTAVTNKQNQQNELYLFRAVNGKITLSPEVVLEAPASKAVSTDTVNIDKDKEMIVFVDTSKYEAYAYYPSGDTKYNAHNFAVAAGNEDLAG